MKKSELFFVFALLPVDIIMILLAFGIAYWLRSSQDIIYISPFPEYMRLILLTLPGWIVIFALEGLYHSKNGRRGADELAGIFMGVSAGIMILVAWLFLAETSFFSRLVIVYAWIIAIVLVFLGRSIVRAMQKYLYRYGIGVHRIIFVGNNQITYNLVKAMQTNRALGYKVIGVVDADHLTRKAKSEDLKIKILGKFSEIEKIISSHPTDEIILTELNISNKKISQLIDFCEDKRLIFKQSPNLFEVKTQNTEMFTLAGIPILKYRHTPLEGWGKITKRFFDLSGSFLSLIILSPLFGIVALIIKATSPGPIFFRQTRMREDGKTFTFLKFRSMQEGAEGKHKEYMKKYGVVFKLKNDPRVTPFGKFMRRTSIDELPQFWNVLMGEMSLVGPRPPMVEEVAFYNRIQKKRLAIKPGITGLWQVSGRSDVNFDDWVRLDLYYIENWSLWLDLIILAKTFVVVLGKKGAY